MQLLIRNQVPFEKFILSKSLSSEYKAPEQVVQFRVNRLRKEREEGSEEAVGSRVEYVILDGVRNAKTTDLAEDPTYARTHNLKLNRLWYFEHAIEKPMRSFFSILEEVNVEEAFAGYRAQLNSARLNVSSVLRDMMVDGGGASSSADGASSSTGAASSSSSAMSQVTNPRQLAAGQLPPATHPPPATPPPSHAQPK